MGGAVNYASTLEQRAVLARKMQENRRDVLTLYGRESLDEQVAAVRLIARKTGRDPFQVAVEESIRASKDGEGIAALQLSAVACEIAEVS